MQTYGFLDIYNAMLGESSPIPGVEDAFAEGEYCAVQYEIMWEAYTRLLDRLNQPGEDPDLEIIRCTLSSIQRELCRRMYEYGSQHPHNTEEGLAPSLQDVNTAGRP